MQQYCTSNLKALLTWIKELKFWTQLLSQCHVLHHLPYSNKTIQSGVQQGNPLCALLLSLTMWLIIKEVETKIPHFTQHCWYLDDGIIAWTETKLNEALDISMVSGKTCGLKFITEKCEVWSKGALNTFERRIKRNIKWGTWSNGCCCQQAQILCVLFTEACSEDLKSYWRTWSAWSTHSVLLVFYVVAWVLQI